MRLSRRGGRLRLLLADAEQSVLAGMLGELSIVLGSDEDDPVTRRLFPSAYPDDAAADTEFRSLTESTLRDERRARATACAAELGAEVELTDPAVATRWIQVLNDLRLALGTRLDITEDDPPFDVRDPAEQPRVIYHWLTGIQDGIVQRL